MTSFGAFPPTCIEDIMSYDADETMAGYREYRADEPPPGPPAPYPLRETR